MQSSLHCSVKNIPYWQFVYDLYSTLHIDVDLLVYIAPGVYKN